MVTSYVVPTGLSGGQCRGVVRRLTFRCFTRYVGGGVLRTISFIPGDGIYVLPGVYG